MAALQFVHCVCGGYGPRTMAAPNQPQSIVPAQPDQQAASTTYCSISSIVAPGAKRAHAKAKFLVFLWARGGGTDDDDDREGATERSAKNSWPNQIDEHEAGERKLEIEKKARDRGGMHDCFIIWLARIVWWW